MLLLDENILLQMMLPTTKGCDCSSSLFIQYIIKRRVLLLDENILLQMMLPTTKGCDCSSSLFILIFTGNSHANMMLATRNMHKRRGIGVVGGGGGKGN